VKFWEHGHIVLCAVIVCLFRKFFQQSEAIQLALYKTIQVNVYLISCLGVRKCLFEMCL
jgi:hypothetical protein